MPSKKIQISPTKSNNSQQDITNDLQFLQIENQELIEAIKDIYQKINEVINSMEILKLENPALRQKLALNSQLQQIQGRILQTEQIVKEIQNFGGRKAEQFQMINNPMEIEQQPLTSEIPDSLSENNDLLILQTVRTQSKKLFLILIKIKGNNRKLMGKYLGFTAVKKAKYTEKKYSNQTKKFQIFSTQQMNLIRNEWEQTFMKPLEKTNQKL